MATTVPPSHPQAESKKPEVDPLVAKEQAIQKQADEDKAAAKEAEARRVTEQKVSDQKANDQRARQKAEDEQRAKDRAETLARDPNTYEDPHYKQSEDAKRQAAAQGGLPYTPQKPEEVTKESDYPVSEQTKAEMEAGKKAVAAAMKASEEAQKTAATVEKKEAKEAKKAE